MASELLVQTNYGPVQGRHRVGLNGVKYVSFQGIPYAKPPVGSLRFKTPQRPEPWTETFDATVEGPICPVAPSAFDAHSVGEQNEDCLRLNVFKNDADFISKQPVMVNIHGGGFQLCSSSEAFNSPELLMGRDVIMVSMNYRLGVLGKVLLPLLNRECVKIKINRSGWGHKVPVIVGAASNEGYLFYRDYKKDKETMFADDGFFANALPKEINLPYDSKERNVLGEQLKRHYYGERTPSGDNLEIYANLSNEKLFWHGINAIVKARMADSNSAPTFLYQFNFTSERLPMIHMWLVGKYLPGVVLHGEDMQYLFNSFNVLATLKEESSEWLFVDNLLSLWTSFAKTGKPTSEATKAFGWKPVQSSITPYKCLNLGKETTMIDLPNTDHLAFWDSLYDL